MGSSPSAPAKERGIGRASGLFLFLLLWVGGLEGETVQSGLPVDVRDRGRPSAQFARESSPSAPFSLVPQTQHHFEQSENIIAAPRHK